MRGPWLVAAVSVLLLGAGPSDGPVAAPEIVRMLTSGSGDGPAQATLHVEFRPNGAELVPAGAAQVKAIAQALKDETLAESSVRIDVHVHSGASAEFNQGLSERRASMLKRALVEENGIDVSRVEVRGVGDSEPLDGADASTAEGRAASERVVLVNMGPP